MGRYVNVLIPHDFHNMQNRQEALNYAKGILDKLSESWKKQPFGDDFAILEDGEEWGYHDITVTFGENAPWAFWMELKDGYWAVETNFNDYALHWPIKIVKMSGYAFPIWLSWLCETIGTNDAWICFEDRLNNSANAPEELNKWFFYAQEVGIEELTMEMFERADDDHWIISYDKNITGTSHPILHYNKKTFQDTQYDNNH